jgi:integrase/recombinase XerD
VQGTPLGEAAARYLMHRRRQGRALLTLKGDTSGLRRFLEYAYGRGVTRSADLTPEVLAGFAVYLSRRYRRQGHVRPGGRLAWITRVNNLCVVSHFVQYLVREGDLLVDGSSALAIRRPTWSVVDRAVRLEEMQRLVAAVPTTTATGVRNRAILELLFGTGLRRAELTALDVYDVNLRAGEVFVRRGKGGKTRVVPLAGQARRWLRRYIETARPELAGSQRELALFVGQSGGRVHPETVGWIVREAGRAARLERPVSPHKLRHGYATALVRGGADVRHVQKLLGHQNLQTTERYTALDDADLAREYARTHPRAHRR